MHDWDEIRKRYGPLVWNAVYRILNHHTEASDCYQEVFLEAFQQANSLPVGNWAALLRWLAVRRAIDRLRKRRRHEARFADLSALDLLERTSRQPVDEAMMTELVERVRQELARLPDHQAEVFWLRCIEGLSYAEITNEVGLDSNTVGVLIHRAKARLREMLADLNPNVVKHR